MKKSTYTISLNDKNTSHQIVVSKDSCLDITLNNKKDIFNEISYICKKEYNCEECAESLIKNSKNKLIVENGMLLINAIVNQIKQNYLVFFRLKNYVNFDRKLGGPVDIIFAIFTPKSMDSPNRLQIVSQISRMLKRNNIRNAIKGADKAEDIIALLITT